MQRASNSEVIDARRLSRSRAALALPILLMAAAGAAFLLAGGAFGKSGDRWSAEAVRSRYPDPDAGVDAERYAVMEDCAECHLDRLKSLEGSFHAALADPDASNTRACEECHGPGLAHVDDAGDGPIRHPAKANAKTTDGLCLRCHEEVLTKPVKGHREWIEGDLYPEGRRSCTLCHQVHVDRTAPAYDEGIGPFRDVAALAKAGATHIPAEKCIGCHPGFHPEMKFSGHREFLTEGEACGTCHGPGSLHAESAGDPAKIIYPTKQPAPASIASCNRCHTAGESQQRWTCSEHAREEISCIVCHDANAPVGRTLREPQFMLCGSCHADVKAKGRFANRHRMAEGRVECSDCHDPHGNRARVRDKELRADACAACHGEKAGPFLYDHGIKRGEGCVVCHDPHGSPHRRMLSQAQMTPLCIQCHPDTFHNLAEPKFRNCVSCHVEIHGSNLSRFFLR